MLKQAINQVLPTWNKKDERKPGDKLTGYFVRTEKFVSQAYGEGEKYIIADPAGNEKFGLMAQAVIKRAFANIPVGSYVEITYKGTVQGKNGQTIRDYDVLYDDEKKLA